MSQTTKRVFTHKSKLFLILVSMIIFISCKGQYFPDSEGDSGGAGGGGISGGGAGGGSAGGNIVGKDYKLPKGSLSQEEQKQAMDPNKYTATLFKKNNYGSKYFRIPALICTSNGTILAAADRRYDHPADLGKNKTRIDVIVRRSEDLGATWSEPIPIGNVAADTSQNHSDSYGDAFFINCHNGDVLCGFVKEPGTAAKTPRGRTAIYRSKDDGKTWTKQFEFGPAEAGIKNADRGFAASGQGLTLRHGKNAGAKKLMFAYFQWNTAPTPGGLSVTAMVSSDDGVTFSSVGNIKPTTPDNNIDETKAIELSDGTIMLNHRRGVGVGNRLWSKSSDAGANWTAQGIDPEVKDPGNNADFTRYEFNGKHIKTDKYILMINSEASANGKWFFTRKNHHIRLTENEFQNGVGTANGKYAYDKQLVIGGENLYSGYPTITTLPDGTICTLTEETWETTRQPQAGDAGGDDYDIVFRRFNLYWLSDGKEHVDYNTDNLFQYKNY